MPCSVPPVPAPATNKSTLPELVRTSARAGGVVGGEGIAGVVSVLYDSGAVIASTIS